MRLFSKEATFGFRGRAILQVAAVWILVGITETIPKHTAFTLVYYTALPVGIRFGLWVGTALIALRYARIPPGRPDRFAFMALIVAPMIRFMFATMTCVAGLFPWLGQDGGDSQAWIVMVATVFQVSIILLLAAWPEPDRNRE